MFLKFKTTEERRAYGGSDFMELQYCTLPDDTSNKKIVDAEIHHWQLSSLYVFGDDFNKFYAEYGEIIGNGLYGNLKEGSVDFYGINYYNREKTAKIIDRLKECKPKGYEVLLEWLSSSSNYNGFYILGE